MNAQEILAEVEKFGATLVVLDGKLKATPPGVLPSDLKAAIRERAPEIKAALLTVPPPTRPRFPMPAAPPGPATPYPRVAIRSSRPRSALRSGLSRLNASRGSTSVTSASAVSAAHMK
jgi:hypothetical protein